MAENESQFPLKTRSLDELVAFFDANDLGDYLNQMPEAEFEVEIIHKTHLFVIDPDLAGQLETIAKAQQIPSETLINTWLREKISEQIP